MKILIFGSNGLVGSALNRILGLNKNFTVFGATRKDADLFNFEATKKLITDFSPDIIINSAAKVGGILANNTYRTDFLIENIKINLNILESCISYPGIKIINLGSSCIYPLDAENPISEKEFMNGKLEPTNSPYAMAKLTSIELGNAMKLEYGHKVINLMPTNLYGPNDNFSKNDSHVIPGLIVRMHDAKINGSTSFDIWGTGKPLREFLYSEDLASSIEFIIENNIEEELINIGSGEEISIYNLSQLIKSTVGYEGDLVFDSSKPDGNPRKLLDSQLINSLGWKSKTSLENGLIYTYKWFLENY
jgi:GDP-L-fucose synthase